MPLILGTNSIKDTGYDIDYSCRFNSPAVTYMDRTIESPTLGTKWTASFWLKKDLNDDYHHILTTSANPGKWDSIRIKNDNKIQVLLYDEGVNLTTTAVYRDVTAWYSIIVAFDSTQGTDSNRLKLYVNGTQVTAFDTSNYPDQNLIPNFQVSGKTFRIGANTWSFGSGHEMLGGYLAEVFFIDGTALAPTAFGEFDSDSPTIWKPKDCSGDFTYGNNGFYLDFADSGDLGDDESGKGNDFSETGMAAVDQATDTPTNSFATLNPLIGNLSSLTISEGNLNMVASDANYRSLPSTIGATAGKWYAEFKAVSGFSSVDASVGIYRADNTFVATTGLGNFPGGNSWSYGAHGNVRTDEGNHDTGEATFTNGDIIQVAMDLDNLKLYFGKNNTWINSGDPTSGATGTGAYTIINAAPKEFYHFAVASISSGGAKLWSCNFGNPSYSNSSDAADANGYGIFEFAPPSGYYALCTKNLAEFG